MLSGTPVVATDLPGVRQPVRITGMGEIVPPGEEEALAIAIEKVVRNPETYCRERSEIEAIFDISETVARYEQLFAQLIP
jgi:glycosyltransferase involved in cell wall biosynthesis